MDSLIAHVVNADRMMIYGFASEHGIELAFADGRKGMIPFADIPEVGSLSFLAGMELPTPYQIILHTLTGTTIELPWDFARHYCDSSYLTRVEASGAAGRQAIGGRIRQLREATHMTQEQLAAAAGIGRVTLVRIEQGEQSPRFETLARLADALKRPMAELLVSETNESLSPTAA